MIKLERFFKVKPRKRGGYFISQAFKITFFSRCYLSWHTNRIIATEDELKEILQKIETSKA